MSKMFCSKCGVKAEEGSKYCPGCGTPIEVVERVRETGEEILGLIERLNPWGSSKEWNLFFTSSRVIVARVGGGLERSIGGVISHAISEHRSAKKSTILKELSPEEILRNHEDNFAILYSDIKLVKTKKPGRFRPVTKLEIITAQKKHKFSMFPVVETDAKAWWDKCVHVLRSALGNKLIIK